VEPRPVDVAPTVLAHLGVSTVDGTDGEPLTPTRPDRGWDGWARSGWQLVPAQQWLARHGFPRGRGLLAVASASTVDAVLTGPPLPPGPATLSFDCHLRAAAGQQAEITVGTGRAERLLWRGGSDLINARVRVAVDSGPDRVIGWRLRAAPGQPTGCWAVARPEIT
jgi:hypothetical protein